MQSFRGAEDGIENTTYFLVLESGEQLVLTLFESFSRVELPFYIELTNALNARGLPVPCPVQDTEGSAMQMIADKPVLLFPFISGKHIERPNCEELRKVALFLANIHQQSLTLSLRNSCPGDIDWMRRSWNYVKSSLSDDENQIVEDMLL
ncbi:MAG: phosphotransferase, partial [Gammaproteobacteria bacterium]|nr:phosphotransferase [Gammaproteobacteria bacterium]